MLKIDDVNKIRITRIDKETIEFSYDYYLVILKKFQKATIVTIMTGVNGKLEEDYILVKKPIEDFIMDLTILSNIGYITNGEVISKINGVKKFKFAKDLVKVGLVEEISVDTEIKMLNDEINRLAKDNERLKFEMELNVRDIEELQANLEKL